MVDQRLAMQDQVLKICQSAFLELRRIVLYPGVVALKGINPRLKVILSIGGYSEKESSWITISSPTRAITFSKNVISFVRRHGFDGVNLDWETPSAMTAAGFITLVQTRITL
nr:hypothetical protein BaRGS_022304 [Batillaria attramentaria]